jgi:hypothetical protein
VPEGAACAVHPTVSAVDTCERCGAFVCVTCLELLGATVQCPSCFARQGGRAKASSRAKAAIALSIIGLNCGFLPGIIALVLAYQELGAIDRGEAPVAGRRMASGARVLGWINVGLILAGVVAGLATWAFG